MITEKPGTTFFLIKVSGHLSRRDTAEKYAWVMAAISSPPIILIHQLERFYLVVENLVLWARSEIFGYALKSANKNSGVRSQNSEEGLAKGSDKYKN